MGYQSKSDVNDTTNDLSKWNSDLKIFRAENTFQYSLDKFETFNDLKKQIIHDTGKYYHDDDIMVTHYDGREVLNNFEELEDMMDLGSSNCTWMKGSIEVVYHLIHTVSDMVKRKLTLNEFLDEYDMSVFPINRKTNDMITDYIKTKTDETHEVGWLKLIDSGRLHYHQCISSDYVVYMTMWSENVVHVVVNREPKPVK